MKYTCVMGVDPGISGAIAFYFPEFNDVSAYDVPVVDGQINGPALADLIKQYIPDIAVVEAVHSMPKQGVASTFKFGVAYGIALGVIGACHIPMVLITPTSWKKKLRLSADKEEARAAAIRQFPANTSFSRKKDHGRAEAALIAVSFVS